MSEFGGAVRLPGDISTENYVLGAILSPVGGSQWGIIAMVEEVLPRAEMFNVPASQMIYRAAQACWEKRGSTVAAEVASELQRRGELHAVGGHDHLAQLAASFPATESPSDVVAKAQIVRLLAVRRDLINVGGQITAIGWQGPSEEADPEGLIADAERSIRQLSVAYIPDLATTFDATLDKIFAEVTGRLPAAGLRTGYSGLDALHVYLNPGDLVVVGGRPGVGKTAFVARIAWHLATETVIPVLFFTGETTTSQMAKRMLAVATGVPLSALMEGRVREEMSQLEAARAKAEGAPLILDGAPQVSMAVLAGKARRARTVDQVRVVIVDGFQRIRGNPAENSRDLKDLAMQLGITVVVTSQLYHGLELRDDKTPILADLAAERPELEQDGATIILLHRLMREGEEQSTEAEARVVKHRLGPTGNAPLTFQRFPVRFVDRG